MLDKVTFVIDSCEDSISKTTYKASYDSIITKCCTLKTIELTILDNYL
jgi:hypothetical protein